MEQYTLATPGCTPPHSSSQDTSSSNSGQEDVDAQIARSVAHHDVLAAKSQLQK